MEEIFSGKNSEKMWQKINNVGRTKDLQYALYGVCCRLQELESKYDREIEELKEEIKTLKYGTVRYK